jgi:hypothetical protein
MALRATDQSWGTVRIAVVVFAVVVTTVVAGAVSLGVVCPGPHGHDGSLVVTVVGTVVVTVRGTMVEDEVAGVVGGLGGDQPRLGKRGRVVEVVGLTLATVVVVVLLAQPGLVAGPVTRALPEGTVVCGKVVCGKVVSERRSGGPGLLAHTFPTGAGAWAWAP